MAIDDSRSADDGQTGNGEQGLLCVAEKFSKCHETRDYKADSGLDCKCWGLQKHGAKLAVAKTSDNETKEVGGDRTTALR